MYYPHQAAEIVRLCIAAGVPEEAILWLRDGYSVDAVARELQQRSSRPHAAMPAPSPGSTPAPAVLQLVTAGVSWSELRQANAERLAQQRKPGR
jgi:hypothetical protein